jgi:hypothetical protein
MEWPARGHAIALGIYQTHRALFEGDDDTRRAAMRLIAEQVCYELGPDWGLKSAGPGRPQGPSQIAYRGGPILIGFRILDGDGSVTGVPNSPIPHPPMQSFEGQTFIDVEPIDHLGTSVEIPPIRPMPPPNPAPYPTADPLVKDVAALMARIDALEQRVADLTMTTAHTLKTLQTRRYVAQKFGITIVSVPEGQ